MLKTIVNAAARLVSFIIFFMYINPFKSFSWKVFPYLPLPVYPVKVT